MRNGLTVLLTNIWLANRGGSEIVVRDFATGLLRRGHRPIVYSPELGEIAAEIRSNRQQGEPKQVRAVGS